MARLPGRDPRSRRPVADDSTYLLLGAFAQLRKPLNQRLETTFGARITHAEAELGKVWDPDNSTDISASADWSNVVFNARALYRLDDSWNLYGGASQGFRAPNAHDLSGTQERRGAKGRRARDGAMGSRERRDGPMGAKRGGSGWLWQVRTV